MTNDLTDMSNLRELPRTELLLGVVALVTARSVGVNLTDGGAPSGSHFLGHRYGRGEVGEIVLIEGQRSLLLGRIAEIHLQDSERRAVTRSFVESSELYVMGTIQILGCIALDTLRVSAGVDSYPRLGDRVYSAPHELLVQIPQLMDEVGESSFPVTLEIGTVEGASQSVVRVKPERLFGRHCAILGATGGGKSWTTARIVEECIKHNSKVILLDATGEYRGFGGDRIGHCHLGNPVTSAQDSVDSSLPHTSFIESDFVAMFEPAGKVQGPKLRAAMRSLRLAKLRPDLAPDGFIRKIDQPKGPVEAAERLATIAEKLDDPTQAFDVHLLSRQIEQECVYPEGFGPVKGQKDPTKWGGEDGNFSYCLSLLARIESVLMSPAYACIFQHTGLPSLTKAIDDFVDSDQSLLRICLSGISYEYHAREIISNVIGRHLLMRARAGAFHMRPTLVVVDEAHNFLGHQIGGEDYASRLDAFELIAKEGRKYGLNICLASQRPRDLTEGVLSQMGTMIVHRLTNDRDREVVERACGELDRSSAAYLPNLRPGEAAIIGIDFPIPLTIKILEPVAKPRSDGPDYQQHWVRKVSSVGTSGE